MACKLVKKGLISAALGAGALALLFGTAAPSYVRTAFHKVRHNAREAVPIQYDIERARMQVADLEPAMRHNIEELARAEEDVRELNEEIALTQKNHEKEGREIAALRDSLRNGDLRLAGGATYTADEVKLTLARKFEGYRQVKRILEEKQKTLKAKEQAVAAARDMLNNIQAQRKTLLTRIDEIEARNKSIEATQAHNDFHFDNTPLAEVKKTIADLERRVNVKARTAEIEGRFADHQLPVATEPTGDVLKEIDAEFGPSSAKTTDKSL